MCFIPFFLSCAQLGDPAAEVVERARYFRPAGKKFVLECEFTQRKGKSGSSIDSVTGRGPSQLSVSSQYDERDRLITAKVTITRDGKAWTATVAVAEGTARIQRDGQKAQEFDVPPGVIVTSAPDWTDTFVLCRRYDLMKGGKQSLPGLWIHPEQASQRLTFAIERTGADAVEHAGKKLRLERYMIWLRGMSRYIAWADETGKMIKLVPLPFQEKASNWLVLEGYEKSVSGLRPTRE